MKLSLSSIVCLFCLTLTPSVQADKIKECINALDTSHNKTNEAISRWRSELALIDSNESEQMRLNRVREVDLRESKKIIKLYKQHNKIIKQIIRQIEIDLSELITLSEQHSGFEEAVTEHTIIKYMVTKTGYETLVLQNEQTIMEMRIERLAPHLSKTIGERFIRSADIIVRQVYHLPNRRMMKKLLNSDIPQYIVETEELIEQRKIERKIAMDELAEQEPELDEKGIENNINILKLDLKIAELEKNIAEQKKHLMRIEALLNFKFWSDTV